MGKKRVRQVNAPEPRTIARANARRIEELNKPRRSPNKAFKAKYDGQECPKCFKRIAKGDTVRYDGDGALVHVTHKKQEIEFKFCDRCFLTLPCECD
jgi:hypothetical protein